MADRFVPTRHLSVQFPCRLHRRRTGPSRLANVAAISGSCCAAATLSELFCCFSHELASGGKLTTKVWDTRPVAKRPRDAFQTRKAHSGCCHGEVEDTVSESKRYPSPTRKGGGQGW
jgi:hypothetical protein